MKITYFIRNNNNSYPEPCDVASIKIIKGKKIFYYGALWGIHNPTDAIECRTEDVDNFDCYSWLKSLGYDCVPEQDSLQ